MAFLPLMLVRREAIDLTYGRDTIVLHGIISIQTILSIGEEPYRSYARGRTFLFLTVDKVINVFNRSTSGIWDSTLNNKY